MKLKPEEVKAKLDEVVQNLGDQARATAIMAELATIYTEGYSDYTKAKEVETNMLLANEKLRQTNMELFLQIGEKPKDIPNKQNPPADNAPKLDDLIDEKGNLK